MKSWTMLWSKYSPDPSPLLACPTPQLVSERSNYVTVNDGPSYDHAVSLVTTWLSFLVPWLLWYIIILINTAWV